MKVLVSYLCKVEVKLGSGFYSSEDRIVTHSTYIEDSFPMTKHQLFQKIEEKTGDNAFEILSITKVSDFIIGD